MQFKYDRGGFIRIATTSGHVTYLSNKWKELMPPFYDKAMQTPGVVYKETAEGAEKSDKEALLRDQTKKALEANYNGLVTKAGKISLIALKEEIGQQVPRHIADSVMAKFKEERGI